MARFIWTLKGRAGLGVGVFGGLLLVFYFAFYSPQIRMMRTMRDGIEKESLIISKTKVRIEEYREMEKKYEELKAEIEKLNSLLSPEGKIHSLLQELSLRAQTYGIDYINIAPEESIKGEYYDRLPVRISLNSTYHALGTLVSDIGKKRQETFLRLDSLEIRGLETYERSSRNLGKHTIEANLLLSLYLSPETPPKPTSSTEGEAEAQTVPGRRR